ncbi:hypothetical protein ACFFGR_19410 [Arthrobacter liuii]|uniref:Uncharacterized protein n=1 Tax=Arthrobacter liuii TaxID=1476996 RepID=A0ABQ2AJ15_9MICC|nr:hypothetical protein [Arthrobacter liuii]GGH91098.1 hypothetical protein GCM10007170_06450 [Arthrobacter liuii]
MVLALEYDPAVRDVCTATQSTATLSSISLTTQGAETAPTTVAEFLAPSVPAILIPVPADLAHRYPDAALKLVPPSDVDAQAAALPAGSRIISISSTHGAASTTLGTQAGRPALTTTGTGQGLRTAPRALADTKSTLADGATVTGMTATVPAAGPEQTSRTGAPRPSGWPATDPRKPTWASTSPSSADPSLPSASSFAAPTPPPHHGQAALSVPGTITCSAPKPMTATP